MNYHVDLQYLGDFLELVNFLDAIIKYPRCRDFSVNI